MWGSGGWGFGGFGSRGVVGFGVWKFVLLLGSTTVLAEVLWASCLMCVEGCAMQGLWD